MPRFRPPSPFFQKLGEAGQDEDTVAAVSSTDVRSEERLIRSFGWIGRSASLAELCRKVQRYCASAQNVVIIGETGTALSRYKMNWNVMILRRLMPPL